MSLEIDKDTLTDEQNKVIPQGLGNIDGTIDNRTLIDIAVMKQAGKGNIEAVKYIDSVINENEVESHYYGLPANVIGKDFVDIYRDILSRGHRFYEFEGGRGSLKSSFCALVMIDTIEQNPQMCGIAMRQVKDTLKDSVYSQIVWAIDVLGLSDDYKCTASPLQITKKSTGQIIYFRGGDDPMKIKSIKPPKGMYIGIAWYEEKDQFKGLQAIRNINQSIMRGGNDFIFMSSYNTPRSQHHFVNMDKREVKENRIVHKSSYKNAPVEWLGQPFFEEAEHLKVTNEKAYLHEYEGEAVGIGDNVFDNVDVRPITDKEIEEFDRLYFGQDWGWYPDPNHFAGMHYDAARRTLYIFEEIRANKCSNEEWAKKIEHRKNDRITADLDNKSIADMRSMGFDMRGAIKGPGSVDYSMKWLQSLTEIVIDNTRCPHTANEFLLYEYEKDKDGNVISGYPDKDNHAIDAVRYALESVWKRRGQ